MNEELLQKLLRSKKYRDVCPDTVRRVLDLCLTRHKKPKDAEKAAREQLHGLTGAFLTPEDVRRCAAAMDAYCAEGDPAQLEKMLLAHASTRERLPLSAMDAMYARIFEAAGTPESVLDLACGVNPLYLGARGVRTLGVDISGAAVAIVNRFGAEKYGRPVAANCADLLCESALPAERFDLALLFKVLPLLERARAGAARDVLTRVNARSVAVSFPTRTLGGRNVGMEENYAAWMEAHLPGNREIAARFATANELFYILKEK